MKKIIIFGCGGVAIKAMHKIESEGFEVIAFTDNNRDLWDTQFQNKKVISVESILNYPFDYIAIGVYKAAILIKRQLVDMGIDESKIVIPIEPNRIFENPIKVEEKRLNYLSPAEYMSESTKRYNKYQIKITDLNFLEKIENLKNILHKNKVPIEKVCVVSGAVLQVYGLRKSKLFDDIDIIMTSDLRDIYGKGLVIVSEFSEMHPENEYDIDDDTIINDINSHFIFKDVKFMNLNLLYRNMKNKDDEIEKKIKAYL